MPFEPNNEEEEMMPMDDMDMEEGMMDGDVMSQLDMLANDFPKLKKDIESLKKKVEDEMGEMPEDEEDFDPAEDEEMDEMDYEDEDLDSILG